MSSGTCPQAASTVGIENDADGAKKTRANGPNRPALAAQTGQDPKGRRR